ncbi:MAG: LysR substrate-binding domain-containing protein [Pseudomonas sp.]|nr:LysR substrate-binding domain-containing protein [Pseudomonas sp.]
MRTDRVVHRRHLPRHPGRLTLDREQEIDLADVRDATFITLTQGFATHQDGNRVFNQAGFEPKVAMQVNDIFTLLSMVSSGVGYALLPGRIAAVYENRVKLIPLQPRYRLQQHIGVVFLKAKERDPNLLALLAECRMYANRQPETPSQASQLPQLTVFTHQNVGAGLPAMRPSTPTAISRLNRAR